MDLDRSFSYRDLEIWQLGMGLAVDIYKATGQFPDEERFGLTSQVRRCATSVPLNIAEGWGRGTQPNLANGVRIARGSLCETETAVELACRLGFLPRADQEALFEHMKVLGRKSHAFLRKVEGSYAREEQSGYDFQQEFMVNEG